MNFERLKKVEVENAALGAWHSEISLGPHSSSMGKFQRRAVAMHKVNKWEEVE